MNYSDWQEIFRLDWPGLWPVLGEASRLRERHFGRRVSFCVIINAKSGALLRGLRLLLPVGPGAERGAPLSPAPQRQVGGRGPGSRGRGGGLALFPGHLRPGGHVAPGSERHPGGGGRHPGGRAHPGLRLPGDCGPGFPYGLEGRGAVPLSPQPGDRGLLFSPDLHHPHLCRAGGHHRGGARQPGLASAPGASWGWGRAWPSAGSWPRRSKPWPWTPFP